MYIATDIPVINYKPRNVMKQLIVLIIITLFYSCNHEDSEEASIIGKWSLQKKEMVRGSDGQVITYTMTECQKQSVYEFRQDDRMITLFDTVDGICTQKGVYTLTYTFDKPTMKVWFEGVIGAPLYVIKLTSSELVLEDRDHNYDTDIAIDTLREFYVRMN